MYDLETLRERVEPLMRQGYVGSCVNGVTHDVNNHLGAILAYSELIDQDADMTPETRRMLVNIQNSVKKCTELLGSLTMIARKPRHDSSVIDLATFVDQVLNLKRYDFKMARVALEYASEEGIPNVLVDRPNLAMAILYILFNAYEAVAGTPNARISVRASKSDCGAEISIKDTGPGIPEADLERIFQPFYSPKGNAHMGLGLTLARETARDLGGDLTYSPTRGFVFKIMNPKT